MANTGIFTVGGTVQAGGGLYLHRQADEELVALCREGTFAYVLTARQMGKSSLMIRTAERLAAEGRRSVVVDLTQIGVQITEEAWYLGFVITVARRLRLRASVFDWWKEHADISFAQRLSQFFQDVVLAEIPEPVVVFIDEIDSTLSLPFTDDFFAAIRYVYNARAEFPEFFRLSFVLIGVAVPGDLISDPKRTPFNVGREVDARYFTEHELLPLAAGFGVSEARAEEMLHWVYEWTSGHPYLTQRLCAAVARDEVAEIGRADVDRIAAYTFLGQKSEEDSNLRFVHDMLTRRAPDVQEVLRAYQMVLQGKRLVDDRQSIVLNHLKLSGILTRREGRLEISNRIYASVFDRVWLKEQWPEHWIRRVPPAVRFAVAASFAAVVLLGLALLQTQQVREAQRRQAEGQAANIRLQAEVERADSLRGEAESASLQIGQQVAVADSLNLALSAQYSVSENLRSVAVAANLALSRQFGLTDSLYRVADGANRLLTREIRLTDSLRSVAEDRFSEREAARLETITLALAVTASRQLLLGDVQLAALLARQAFHFSRQGTGEFAEPVYDALRRSLNAMGPNNEEPLGGPVERGGLVAGARAVAHSPDGRFLAAAVDNGDVLIWPKDGTQRRIHGHTASVRALAFAASGDVLYTAGDDRTVRIWRNLDSEHPVSERLGRFGGAVWALAVSPDGSLLATAGRDSVVTVWQVTGAEPPRTLTLSQPSPIRALDFSPDGGVLALGTDNGTVVLWSFRSSSAGRSVWSAGQGRVLALAYSPDGSRLATGGDRHTVRLWRLGDPGSAPRLERELRGHEGPVNALAFSRDGSLLASAGGDHSVQLWDMARLDRSPILLREHSSWVWSLAFSPDGRRLVSGGADRRVFEWRVRSEELAEDVCPAVGNRNLSREEWRQFVGGDFPYETSYQPCSRVASSASQEDAGRNGK